MAAPKKTQRRSVNFKRRKERVKRASSLFLRSTRLRTDPKFAWVGDGNTQPPNSEGSFGLWYSPARFHELSRMSRRS
jgi:hypothetical protein